MPDVVAAVKVSDRQSGAEAQDHRPAVGAGVKPPAQFADKCAGIRDALDRHVTNNHRLSPGSKVFLKEFIAAGGSPLFGASCTVSEHRVNGETMILVSWPLGADWRREVNLRPALGVKSNLYECDSLLQGLGATAGIRGRDARPSFNSMQEIQRQHKLDVQEFHKLAKDYISAAKKLDFNAMRAAEKQLAETDWRYVDVLKELHGIIVGCGSKDGTVLSHHLPSNLLQVVGEEKAGAYLREQKEEIRGGAGKMDQHAFAEIAGRICFLAEGRNASSIAFKRTVQDICHSVYQDSTFYQLPGDVFLPGKFLQYGAWLGDSRALERAELVILDYCNGPSPEKERSYRCACFALQKFNSDDSSLWEKQEKLLQKVISSPSTPVTLKEKLSEK